jgi:hypothetical protein
VLAAVIRSGRSAQHDVVGVVGELRPDVELDVVAEVPDSDGM